MPIASLRSWFSLLGRPGRDEVQHHFSSLGSVERMKNAFFRLQDFDGHLDTPIDALHTLLLGPLKYLFEETIELVKQQRGGISILKARMNCFDSTCLPRPLNSSQTVNYTGSLIGKDLKALVQAAPFVFNGLIDARRMEVIMTFATLARIIFVRHICDIEIYRQRLLYATQKAIIAIAKMDFSYLNRIKFHLLLHLVDHVQRFGPAMLTSVEKFESYNGITRKMGLFTNRHSPSHDIAATFGNWHAIRHLISGGSWKESASGRWVRAGDGLTRLFENKLVQQLMGYTRRASKHPIRRLWKQLQVVQLGNTESMELCPIQIDALGDGETLVCTYERVSTLSGEMCRLNSFVMLVDEQIGRVHKIFWFSHEVYVLISFVYSEPNVLVLGCPKL